MYGCMPQNNGYIDIESGISELTLSGTRPYTIEFTASSDWYARITYVQNGTEDEENSKWLSMTPMSGSAGTYSAIVIANSPNNSGVDRQASIEIRLPADASKTIKIIQPSVPKPKKLISITRIMSGGILSGPSAMAFGYDDDDELISFSTGSSSQQTQYSLSGAGSSTAAINVSGPGDINWSIPIRMVNDRVSSTEQMLWSFADQYTGIILDQSSVAFSFSYDSSDNKLLQQATRTETIIMRDGETLPSPIQLEETLQYKYTAIRMDSLIHIKKYSYTENETTIQIADTIKYSLKYPADQNSVQDNNLTADIWDIIVFPELQGIPFYSFTGYTTLNLIGNTQPSFPYEVSVETFLHSPDGLTGQWPDRYAFSYDTDSDGQLQNSSSDAVYNQTSAHISTSFNYSDN